MSFFRPATTSNQNHHSDDNDHWVGGIVTKKFSIIPADAEPLTLTGNGAAVGSSDEKRLAEQVDLEQNNNNNNAAATTAKTGSKVDGKTADYDRPKESFGTMKGCVRDGHCKHAVLWLGNVVYLCIWFHHLAKGCEEPTNRYYSNDCYHDDPGFFWVEMKWFAFFVWLIMYGLYFLEFWLSSTRKYLLNVNTSESLIDYMNRLYRTDPTLSITIECYHYETRVVTYTDSNGNTQTRTETYPVVTYTENEAVHILTCEDESVRLRHDDVSEYQVTKCVFTKSFAGDDNFDQQRSMLIERNRHRDAFYNLITNYNIAGFKDRMLSYVDLERKPPLLTSGWCYFFHITLFLALPYRIWMSSITGKVEANVHKRLTTSRVPGSSTPHNTVPTASKDHNGDIDDDDDEEDEESQIIRQQTAKPVDPIVPSWHPEANTMQGTATETCTEAVLSRYGRRPSNGLKNKWMTHQEQTSKAIDPAAPSMLPEESDVQGTAATRNTVEATIGRYGRRPSGGLENRCGGLVPGSTRNTRPNATLKPYVARQTPAPQIVATVNKETADQKLGITLERDKMGHFTISYLSPSSPFLLMGLTVGMRVISINDVDISGRQITEAMVLFRESIGDTTVTAEAIPKPGPSYPSPPPPQSPPPSTSVSSPPAPVTTSTTTRMIVTKRTVDEKLGVKLNRDDNGVFTVSGMSKESPFRNTALKVGNRVISINGVELTGVDMTFVKTILQSTVGQIVFETIEQDHIEWL